MNCRCCGWGCGWGCGCGNGGCGGGGSCGFGGGGGGCCCCCDLIGCIVANAAALVVVFNKFEGGTKGILGGNDKTPGAGFTGGDGGDADNIDDTVDGVGSSSFIIDGVGVEIAGSAGVTNGIVVVVPDGGGGTINVSRGEGMMAEKDSCFLM